MNEKQALELVEKTLGEVLPAADARPRALAEAMRYAVGSGGKRIRPLVCLASAVAAGGAPEDARYPAAAIELLHNYTLVHDDLPAMDNDELRRGRPTVWKRFGEANAILAGDALQALAFRTAAKAPRNVAQVLDVLGEMGVGVVRGQVEDVEGEGNNRIIEWSNNRMGESTNERAAQPLHSSTFPLLHSSTFVYLHKTADLFVAAAKTGAWAAGGTADTVERLGEFALNLGLAFQYEDDLLDGDGIFPREETARRVRESTDAAVAALDGLPGDATFLRGLAQRLVGRKA